MSLSAFIDRTVTELDHVRLRNLMRRRQDALPQSAVHLLSELIDNADVVPSRDVGAEIVTMYSQVRLRERPQGHERVLTLCYPDDAEPEKGFVSVLSPVGVALLGARAGCCIRWLAPDGRQHEAEVAEILFQPEASGDYTL
ncbi:nucleoside diphosphate kinase regulator [Tepidicella xavieri]|uniref:Regulator of nucleoside diphosphate kinase n=1 Tax=Tepidicella xavieri TaxID=360241 RepID=A0A4R6UJA9_9BURK|nr:nucleoside diphosphate kinase regulator [Tepidicella xavieri]TDQ45135.1 regulator of nucleoside diphosphate kinase [Tepidicella xavieri]